MGDDGIVELLLAEPTKSVSGPAHGPARPFILALGKDLPSQLQLLFFSDVPPIEIFQRTRHLIDKGGKLQFLLPRPKSALILRASLAITIAEEQDRRLISDKIGQALVEIHSAADKEGVVKQLVKDKLGQSCLVVPKEMGEQRVIEPAQGAEGRRRADKGIIPLSVEAFTLGFRCLLRKKAFVRNISDKKKPPGVNCAPDGLNFALSRLSPIIACL